MASVEIAKWTAKLQALVKTDENVGKDIFASIDINPEYFPYLLYERPVRILDEFGNQTLIEPVKDEKDDKGRPQKFIVGRYILSDTKIQSKGPRRLVSFEEARNIIQKMKAVSQSMLSDVSLYDVSTLDLLEQACNFVNNTKL